MNALHRTLLPATIVLAWLAAAAPPAAADVTTTHNANVLTLQGTDEQDVARLQSKPGDSNKMQVIQAGQVTHTIDYAAFDTLIVNLGAGDDSFVIEGEVTSGETTTIFAGAGRDTVFGGDGNETIHGNAGPDKLSGRRGVDDVHGEEDDDAFQWETGDGNDNLFGGAGVDRLGFAGGPAADTVQVVGFGPDLVRAHLFRAPGNVFLDISDIERTELQLREGDDKYIANGGLSSRMAFIVNGEEGADTLTTGDLPDDLTGGPGNDTISSGSGDDRVHWDVGDGEDTYDAGSGGDNLLVRGNSLDEEFRVRPGATGGHFALRRIGDGGIDAVGAEHVTVNAANGNDRIVAEPEVGAIVRLSAHGEGGDDEILGAAAGEALFGGPGNDSISGRDGDDQVNGGPGVDRLEGGPGADTFVCGGIGDIFVDLTPADQLFEDCGPRPAEPEQPTPEQPAPSQPGGSQDPGGQTRPGSEQKPAPDPGLPAGFLGFAKPKVKASLKTLTVRVTNTHSAPITVSVAATEQDGLKKAAKFKRQTRTIAPGKTATYELATPGALKKLLAKTLKKRGSATRKPAITVTNVVTNARVQLKPKVSLRRAR